MWLCTIQSVFLSGLGIKLHVLLSIYFVGFLGTVQCASKVLWKHGNDQLVNAGLFIFTHIKTLRMSENNNRCLHCT